MAKLKNVFNPSQNFKPPLKIEITSDGSILEYKGKLVINTITYYTYEYLNSVKKGRTVEYSQEYITQQLSNYFKSI